MDEGLTVENKMVSFEKYYKANKVSTTTQNKLNTVDFMIVPNKYSETQFYFAQESIDFIKFCRQYQNEYTIDILADGDIEIRDLHSFDLWLPTILLAQEILLPIILNLVSTYINDKMKGREKEEANVNVSFIIKREKETKTLKFSGNYKAFQETFEKINLKDL